MQTQNPRLKKIILQIVSRQIKGNDPPETKQTLERLIAEGYSAKDAKELIGAVVATHLFDMLNEMQKFDKTKFVEQLNKLPELP